MQHRCNLAVKKSRLECTCVNNDSFIVLVSGGGRCCWVSMCTVWSSHSKWLRELSNKSALNFVLSLNIPPWKLSGLWRGFWGQCSKCSTNKSVAQILQRWSKICLKWSMFWKAYNKQNTWECWTCMDFNQQRLATDSVRTRCWF